MILTLDCLAGTEFLISAPIRLQSAVGFSAKIFDPRRVPTSFLSLHLLALEGQLSVSSFRPTYLDKDPRVLDAKMKYVLVSGGEFWRQLTASVGSQMPRWDSWDRLSTEQ